MCLIRAGAKLYRTAALQDRCCLDVVRYPVRFQPLVYSGTAQRNQLRQVEWQAQYSRGRGQQFNPTYRGRALGQR